MLKIDVDDATLAAKGRIAMLQVLRLNLSLMENWREAQMRGWGKVFDYESTIVAIAAVVIRGQGLESSLLEKEQLASLRRAIPAERLTKCNISSIAATTGLNRETVRRRFKALEQAGVMVRDPDGGVAIAPTMLKRDETRDVLRTQLRIVSRAVNDLIASGILAVSDSSPADKTFGDDAEGRGGDNG